MELNQLTEAVIGAAIEVHRVLGPGLLESTYHACLCRELGLRGIPFEKEVNIPVFYKGVQLECGYRADIIVDKRLLLELKSVEAIDRVHEAQLLTYLHSAAGKSA